MGITHDKYFFGRFQDGNSEALQASANTGLTLKDCLLGNENPWIYSSAWCRIFCLVSPFWLASFHRKKRLSIAHLAKQRLSQVAVVHRRAHLNKQTFLSVCTYSSHNIPKPAPPPIAQKPNSVLLFSSKIILAPVWAQYWKFVASMHKYIMFLCQSIMNLF